MVMLIRHAILVMLFKLNEIFKSPVRPGPCTLSEKLSIKQLVYLPHLINPPSLAAPRAVVCTRPQTLGEHTA